MRYLFSVLAVAFLAAACGSPDTEAAKEPELTAEKEVAHNERIAVAVRVLQLAHDGGANEDLPDWVASQYSSYEEREYTSRKAAFQRSVGWGTGSYRGEQFYWFAYTNTDAYLQFNLSVALTADDLGKVIGGKDIYGRARDAQYQYPAGVGSWIGYPAGVGSWIGDTNDWMDFSCTTDYQLCDIGGALEKSVADLNKDLPGLELVIMGKFPW